MKRIWQLAKKRNIDTPDPSDPLAVAEHWEECDDVGINIGLKEAVREAKERRQSDKKENTEKIAHDPSRFVWNEGDIVILKKNHQDKKKWFPLV